MAFATDPRPAAGGPWPRYSFLVPAHQAAATFGPLLDSIEAQRASGLDFEVVVADDASTDATPELVRGRPGVRLVSLVRNRGPSVARNAAACASTGEWLVFLDADVLLPPGTLANVHEFLAAHPEAGAVHWPCSLEALAPGPVARYRTLLDAWMTRTSGGGTRRTSFFSVRGGAVRRELFFAAGGFDPRYRRADVEDWDLSRRLAPLCTILHTDAWAIHHRQSPSFAANFKNYLRRSFQFLRLLARTRAMDDYTETTPGNSMATLSVLPGLVALAAAAALGLLGHPRPALAAGAAGAGLLALFLAANAGFWRLVGREAGCGFLPLAVALRATYSVAVALGVGLAVLLWPLGGWPFEGERK